MEPIRTDTLAVPGATLYYEVRGSGPVLLLICGGVYDAAGYAPLADELADRYTVVTYDRRGNSRSPLDGDPEPQRIEVHGDDAHRVLSAVGVTKGAPAHVFGNSSGAIIGLELAARHPEQVGILVAHEPPLFDLLPDREHWRGLIDQVEAAFDRDGPEVAMGVLGAGLAMQGGDQPQEHEPTQDEAVDEPGRIPGGGDAPQGELDPETMAMMERIGRNMGFFVGYEVPPFSRYVPDLDTLRASSVRIVAAAGAASGGEPPHLSALALADRLGVEAVLVPGDHGGFGAEPQAFAARLDDVLSAD